jgi:hypothetical protein
MLPLLTTYYRVCNDSGTTDAIDGENSVGPSGAHEFITIF